MAISESEKEQIRMQAKKMTDSFSEKLSRVKTPDAEPVIKKKSYEREQGNGEECDSDFRKIMFENAPKKEKDFILAEKKKWE
ncbi:MAG TPA: hypothetical protein VMC07_02460 [Candidatus Omnitrophota bacterium]|nr:hypothetical protein [Candidatus Omnitrophota bacterium]